MILFFAQLLIVFSFNDNAAMFFFFYYALLKRRSAYKAHKNRLFIKRKDKAKNILKLEFIHLLKASTVLKVEEPQTIIPLIRTFVRNVDFHQIGRFLVSIVSINLENCYLLYWAFVVYY